MSLRRKFFYLKRHSSYLTLVLFAFTLILVLLFYLYLKSYFKQLRAAAAFSEKVLGQTDLILPEKKEVNLLKKPLSLLLLGVDSRRGDQRPRCDAIHLVTFSPAEEKIIIISVPRGIHVDLGEEVATPSSYLGNSCHIKGIDFAVEEIIRITKITPDHVIKVNFSQVLGALRLLQLPTTPTLQFLRDRKSYYWGDNQRSHNQALFIKDMILTHTQQVSSLPKIVKKLAFKTIDADGLDFETANSILNWVVKNNLAQKPDQIELVIRPQPSYQIKDIHFAESKFATESAWQDDQGFQEYQAELESYLKNLAKQGKKYLASGRENSAYQLLKTPFSQELWLQLENEQLRNQIHFDLLKVYVLSAEDKEEASILVEDFITEMAIAQDETLKKQAEELRENL
jgi:anionic cell wall polymer biosynthesis LytR-Cps2A-Psr (LCP) family protein